MGQFTYPFDLLDRLWLSKAHDVLSWRFESACELSIIGKCASLASDLSIGGRLSPMQILCSGKCAHADAQINEILNCCRKKNMTNLGTWLDRIYKIAKITWLSLELWGSARMMRYKSEFRRCFLDWIQSYYYFRCDKGSSRRCKSYWGRRGLCKRCLE